MLNTNSDWRLWNMVQCDNVPHGLKCMGQMPWVESNSNFPHSLTALLSLSELFLCYVFAWRRKQIYNIGGGQTGLAQPISLGSSKRYCVIRYKGERQVSICHSCHLSLLSVVLQWTLQTSEAWSRLQRQQPRSSWQFAHGLYVPLQTEMVSRQYWILFLSFPFYDYGNVGLLIINPKYHCCLLSYCSPMPNKLVLQGFWFEFAVWACSSVTFYLNNVLM